MSAKCKPAASPPPKKKITLKKDIERPEPPPKPKLSELVIVREDCPIPLMIGLSMLGMVLCFILYEFICVIFKN